LGTGGRDAAVDRRQSFRAADAASAAAAQRRRPM